MNSIMLKKIQNLIIHPINFEQIIGMGFFQNYNNQDLSIYIYIIKTILQVSLYKLLQNHNIFGVYKVYARIKNKLNNNYIIIMKQLVKLFIQY